jgi:hypothetical protein
MWSIATVSRRSVTGVPQTLLPCFILFICYTFNDIVVARPIHDGQDLEGGAASRCAISIGVLAALKRPDNAFLYPSSMMSQGERPWVRLHASVLLLAAAQQNRRHRLLARWLKCAHNKPRCLRHSVALRVQAQQRSF